MTTKTKTKISLLGAAVLAAVVVVSASPRRNVADAQSAPTALTVAIYAPSAAFADAGARLAYVQGLAKSIAAATGIPTTGKAYVKLGDMLGAKPDFAIVEGLCVAAKSPGTVLAVAAMGGSTSESWGLYSRGDNLAALKGKKLTYVKTGCNDAAFMDNAMLRGEVKSATYFAGLVEKLDVGTAVATVRDFKQADAVFAPDSQAKGLSKVIATGAVPTPAFVQINKNIPAATATQVQTTVLSFGAGGGIDGWRAAAQGGYGGLASRLGAKVRRPIFAVPEKVDINDQDVILVPQSATEQASVKQHFWEPPDKR